MKSFKIGIHMEPNYKDSPDAPYFWFIACSSDGGETYSNYGHGWSKTLEDADKEAREYFRKTYFNDIPMWVDHSCCLCKCSKCGHESHSAQYIGEDNYCGCCGVELKGYIKDDDLWSSLSFKE